MSASRRSAAPGRSLDAHRPGLDGVRGWAVIAVVAFHSGLLHAGWVGVDVFMGLSGYLITGVLISGLSSPSGLRLGRFWMRRARRLLPGLVVLLAGVAILSAWGPRDWPIATRRETLGALTYSSNWLRIFGKQSYWELFRAPSALDHLWSLAIEEQFYLVWPLVALVAWKLRGRRAVAAVAAVGVVGLGWWQVWLASHGAAIERIYVGTDTRAPAFLAGAFLMAAAGERSVRVATARWCAGASLVVLAVACVVLNGQAAATYQGPLLAVSVAGAVLAAAAARLDGTALVDRAFTGYTIGLIGRWSYGIYLFHWPLVVLMQPYGGLAIARFCAVLGGATLLAAASYEYFERPIREQTRSPRYRAGVLAGSAVVFLLALVVARVPQPEIDPATAAALRAPLPSAPAPIDTVEVVSATSDAESSETRGTADTVDPADTVGPADTVDTAPAETTTTAAEHRTRLLVVGDSVVYGLRDQLVALGASRGLDVAVRAAPGCTMSALPEDQNNLFSTDLCSSIRVQLRDDVTRFQPDRVVAFLGGTWKPFLWQGQSFDPCSAEGQTAMASAADQYLADLTASGSPVALVIPPQMSGGYGAAAKGVAPCYAQAYLAAQARWPQDVVIEAADLLICPVTARTCEPNVGGVVVRTDGLHYTEAGGELVIGWLLDQLGL